MGGPGGDAFHLVKRFAYNTVKSFAYNTLKRFAYITVKSFAYNTVKMQNINIFVHACIILYVQYSVPLQNKYCKPNMKSMLSYHPHVEDYLTLKKLGKSEMIKNNGKNITHNFKEQMSTFKGVHYSSRTYLYYYVSNFRNYCNCTLKGQQRERVFGLISPFLLGNKGSRIFFAFFGPLLTEVGPDLSYFARQENTPNVVIRTLLRRLTHYFFKARQVTKTVKCSMVHVRPLYNVTVALRN